MSEHEPTLDELEEELKELTGMRDELADHGRYYLFQPDLAQRHGSLSRRIEDLRQQIAARLAASKPST